MIVEFRAEEAADEPFLQRLILSTLTLELGADQWPEPMRTQLLGLQYQNRRMGPRSGFPQGQSCIILVEGAPAGWVFFADMEHEMYLAEIMVLPEFRSRGVGGAAVLRVRELAAGKRTRLNVNVMNAAAIRLYERLGFRRVGGDAVQFEMAAQDD